ncbi:lamin tail domain-containing protein [Streptomyces sp. NPDC087851]|uniref:lamin tail domain-containing protein n=1 Tax=Streptomyces sp. NPDC087851 TaxID=3365810 RepID=UPI00382FED97
MRRTRTLTAAALAVAAGVVLLPTQAQAQVQVKAQARTHVLAAAGSVHLYKIYYDSPGTDKRSNASLNAEYVQIRNTTSKAVSLKGWTLVDASNHRYVFGTYSLGKGKTVTVRTGKGKDTAANRYQNRAAYVWNNDKDTATLKKANGTKADTCSYNSTKVDYKMC